jgi:hypothetical protein
MEFGVVKEVVEFLKADGKAFIRLSYRVITRGPAALDTVDPDNINTLIFGLRFMVYVAVVGFLLEVPVAAGIGLSYDKPAYVASTLLLDLACWLLYGTVFHSSMKWVGGKAAPHQPLAVFCFLTALFLPIMVLLWPLQRYVMPMMQAEDIFNAPVRFTSLSKYVSFAILALVAYALFAYYLTVAFRILQKIHTLSTPRAVLGFGLGLCDMLLLVVLVSLPVQQSIYTVFGSQSHSSGAPRVSR